MWSVFTARYVLKHDTDDLSLTVLKGLKTTLVRRGFFYLLKPGKGAEGSKFFNPLAPELFFLISARPVYKM